MQSINSLTVRMRTRFDKNETVPAANTMRCDKDDYHREKLTTGKARKFCQTTSKRMVTKKNERNTTASTFRLFYRILPRVHFCRSLRLLSSAFYADGRDAVASSSGTKRANVEWEILVYCITPAPNT